jgi:hypothetical protein
MAVPKLVDHTAAIIEALTDADVLAGNGQRPTDAGWQGAEGNSRFRSYAVVYRLSPRHDGAIWRGSDDIDGEWQITTVGPTANAAETVADLCRAALLDPATRTLTVAGRSVLNVTHEGGAGVTRDPDTSPALFFAVDRYRISTTPA